MKRLFLILGLLSVSTMVFSLGCENLGITVINASGKDCSLRATEVLYGSLYRGEAPASIPSGTTGQTFYLQQDFIGAGIRLDYRCENNVVIFYSGQNYCGVMAGDIGGSTYMGNDLGLRHQETMGSYWSSIPGQIIWTIY